MAEPMRHSIGNKCRGSRSRSRAQAFVSIGILLILAAGIFAVEAQAEGKQVQGNVVRVGSDYVVDASTSFSGNIIVFGGNISIQGALEGRAIAVGGTVRVEGNVAGDIVAIGGRTVLLRGAAITGSVNAVGGGVERAENVELCGEVNSISLAQGLRVPQFRLFPFQPRSVPVYTLYLLGLYLTVLAVGYLFPEHARTAGSVLAALPWRSLWVGAVALLLIVPLTVLMVLSVIGRPLILVLWLGFLVAKLLGYVAMVRVTGALLVERLGYHTCTAIHVASGVVALGLLRAIPFVGVISGIVVFLGGLGAALISRLGMGGSWFSLPPKCRARKSSKGSSAARDA